jgi:membrane-bound lytic murein transglycosylase D
MKKKKIAMILISSISVVSALLLDFSYATSEPFPVYPGIVANVRFWIDVYSKFPTTKGILHDSSDLSIIYSVIDLLPPEKHGAPKENAKRIKIAKEKYRKILEQMSENPASQNTETQEIAALFNPRANPPTYRKAMQNIRCQIGQRDRFEEGLTRSSPYVDKIKEIFRSNGMPEDLAYLPHVESSFNPKAYSKAGAAGIWQFTRSTGKKFMKVGRGIDERRDPIRSSKAAAQLLEQNYKILRSWPLAITAYNHGIAGLSKARKTKGSEEAIFSDYSTRRFKFASRNFYSEFLAARHVAINYAQYFGLTEESLSRTDPVSTEGSSWVCASCRQDNPEVQALPLLSPALKQALRE